MANAYFILEDGEQRGPYTFDELLEMEIDIHTRVLSPLAETWQDACDLPEFYPYFLSQGVNFPTEDNLASFWWRLLAFAIDLFIITFFVSLIISVMIVKGVPFNVHSRRDMTILQLILYGILILYFSIFESSASKSSLGKKICKLVVVDEDGMSITFAMALLRSFGKIICMSFSGLPFISIFFSETNQGLHDYLARSYVIRVE